MFLALKNGLGRLAIFFRGLFDEYGGAAAAYSLRRLGSAYSGPLVRVRRDSDDAELDFTSTTSIEDWVNGKLETTLPADVATSSAAFSLRKVKDTYTGDAVRIRRASDDVEVDVAFDTNGAVSASSAITNVTESPDQGDTTATTLGGFLTEGGNQDAYVQTWYDQSVNSNHATQDVAGNQPKIAEAGALLADGIDFDGIDDVLGFTEIPLSSSYAMFGVFDNSALPSDFIARSAITSNSYISLQPDGDIYWETDTNNDGIVNVNTGTPASGTNLLSCLLAASGTGTAFLNGTSGASASFANTNLTVNQLGGRGTTIFNEAQFKEIIIYNSDQSSNRFKIESNINNYYGIYTASHNGFVHTWYDQSGNSNHATQDTQEDDQPQIVSNGSLLADGIDFDGVNHYLVAPDANVLDLTIPCCFFTVQKYSAIPTTFQRILAKELSSNGYNIGASSSGQFDIDIGTADGNGGSVTTNKTVTSWIVAPDVSADNIKVYDNGALVLTTSSVTDVPANTDGLGIGARPNGTVLFDGSMSEIVIYDSDQSANRPAIEANIANQYNLTLS